jgi:hypothetical protein
MPEPETSTPLAQEGHGGNKNPEAQHASQSTSSAVITHSTFGDHTRIHQGNLYMTIQGVQRKNPSTNQITDLLDLIRKCRIELSYERARRRSPVPDG